MALGFKGGSDLLRSTKDIRPHELYKGEELYSPSRYYQGVRIFPKDTPGRLRTYAPCTWKSHFRQVAAYQRRISYHHRSRRAKNNRLDGNQRSNWPARQERLSNIACRLPFTDNRTQEARRSAYPSTRKSPRIRPAEICISSQYEPRDTYPLECHRRILQPADCNRKRNRTQRVHQYHRNQQPVAIATGK